MKTRFYKIAVLLILIISLSIYFLKGCSAEEYKQTAFFMDTRVDVAVYNISKKQAETVVQAIFDEMLRLENILSKHVSGSDVNRINEAAGRVPVTVEPETILVTSRALEIAELSSGAFDPTVGPLVDLWGWGTEKLKVPSAEEINAVLPLVNYKAVKIDKDNSTIFLAEPGMKLDLGGIAKGFIVDRGREIAQQFSVKALFVNAGGDIGIMGKKPSGEKWRVAVQSPRDPQKWAAILEIEEGCVATSGDYERFFEEGGEIYHHILDPEKGIPAGDLSSVTIVASESMLSDALSTAVFVLGKDKGMQLLESLKGIDGLVIDKQGEIHVSSGLGDHIEIPQDE
ncbi:MAG: FAD:protein FMN transferase [Firmicutes bacterium]|nr:FAD:protein FMN transferase [Bacillota bacterium]